MQSKIYAYLVVLIGILLILPLAGFTALGTLTSGVIGWAVAISILVIGIVGVSNSHKK